jgi:hypothetical protein
MGKIMVPPRIWTKVARNFFVFFHGNPNVRYESNTWVECAGDYLRLGHAGLWALHHGPVDSLPRSWDQVTEKRTVNKVD